MKFTGERVIPDAMHSNVDTYQSHLARYVWALPFCVNKDVLDAACGTGYGTDLLDTVAKYAFGVDSSEEAINYARWSYGLNFGVDDLENVGMKHPDLDLIVTFETIEHLKDPVKFLKWCKDTAPEVIGSIPVNCKTPFHKHVWNKIEIFNLIASVWTDHQFYFQRKMNISGLEMSLPEIILFRGIK